jgi:hypothetical protein
MPLRRGIRIRPDLLEIAANVLHRALVNSDIASELLTRI